MQRTITTLLVLSIFCLAIPGSIHANDAGKDAGIGIGTILGLGAIGAGVGFGVYKARKKKPVESTPKLTREEINDFARNLAKLKGEEEENKQAKVTNKKINAINKMAAQAVQKKLIDLGLLEHTNKLSLDTAEYAALKPVLEHLEKAEKLDVDNFHANMTKFQAKVLEKKLSPEAHQSLHTLRDTLYKKKQEAAAKLAAAGQPNRSGDIEIMRQDLQHAHKAHEFKMIE